MTRKIGIVSPTDDWRWRAFVTAPLGELAGDDAAEVKRVRIASGYDTIPAQVDRIDPEFPALDVVSILLRNIRPGGAKLGLETMELSPTFEYDQAEAGGEDLGVYVEGQTRVEMWSNRMRLHIHLPKEPLGYQGGAITSIQLDDRAILDPIRAELGPHDHDPEKRLQADRVRIANPPWSEEAWTEYVVYKEAWTCVHAASGPVRAFANLRSSPFTVMHAGTSFDCHFHRVISIFHDVDYIIDDLYVTGRPSGHPEEPPVQISFAAHFFLKMNFSVFPVITRVPQIPDWFSIGAGVHPWPGYGFASSVPCGRIDNPPIDYPNVRSEHSAFSWELGFAREVRCVHMFKRETPPGIVGDETGRAWFDLIFKPARAKIR
jgi:hypothetical protein